MGATSVSLGMANCIESYGDPKMFGISKIATSYASIGVAQSKESVRSLIEEDASMIVTKDINGVESANVEMQTEDNSFGKSSFLRNTPGNDVIYLKTNPADFNGFVGAFKGGTYWVEPYLTSASGKAKLLHRNSDGSLSGFKAELVASPVGSPAFEGKNQAYKLNCLWDNVDDWEDVVLVPLVDDLSEYVDFMPIGWDYELQGSYATTNQSIKIWERADITALLSDDVTPTARIISYNVSTPVVTAAAPSDGISVLTVTQVLVTDPVTLAAGDYITFVLEKKSGDVVEYTTNPITIKP